MFWKVLLMILVVSLILYFYQQNYLHKLSHYQIFISKFDQEFKGRKIVFISDTHFRSKISIGFIDRILIDIDKTKPDLIVFAGDIVHDIENGQTLEHVKDFFLQLSKIAPTYLIYGNHDIATKRLDEIKATLKLAGAQLLENEAKWIQFEESAAGFWLMGLSDQSVRIRQMKDPLKEISLTPNSQKDPKILLAHHPEFFDRYLKDEKKRPDLILSGHTHGGQVILPIVGGLFAPGQGLLPRYDFGMFTSEEYPQNRMIVSKGIGNSRFPLRMNNRPEVIVIEFE